MPEEMEQRRKEILESADLRGLRARLAERAAPVLARMPVIPA
jgi:TRAP-type mannitol/chloroaromatic compound transport system substrate-binding protein